MRNYYARNKERHAEAMLAWREANPERRKAHNRASSIRGNARRKALLVAEREALARLCPECGGPLGGGLTRQATYCSDACGDLARSRQWKRRNPAKVRAAAARYEAKNRQAINARALVKNERRRARKMGLFVEDVYPLVLLEMDDGVCGICGEDVDPLDFHVDHVIPLARGGEHSYANTQAAHPACNLSKNARLPWEMAA